MTTTFEQNKNERLLYNNIQKQGGDVLWNHGFVSCEEDENGVKTIVKDIVGKTNKTIHSKYVVGCDGAKSMVRKTLGVSFDGGTYPNKFYVADVNLTWDYGYDNVVMMPEKGIFVAFFPLQEERKVRVIGTLPAEYADKENIEFVELEQKMKEVSKIKFKIEALNWFSVYRVHHRVVGAFSKGRIFVAGDAAHIHSPAGGQGMNTGLQDAHNLGWKMAYVLKGYANPSLLNTYNEERLPYAQSLINHTDKGFVFISGAKWWMRTLRSYVVLPMFSVAMKYKRPATELFKNLSQLFYGYSKSSLAKGKSSQSLKFKVGDQLPYIEKEFYNNFKAPTFHLIRLSNTAITDIERDSLQELFHFDIKIVNQKITDKWRKFGVKSELYILVRPDHHILYIGDDISEKKINRLFNAYF